MLIFAAFPMALFASLPFLVIAATSTNYETTQERGGPVEFSASSTNYTFQAEIGHPGVGSSTSTNYIYDHGMFWVDGGGLTATIQWAVPQLRVGAAETNDDVTFYIAVHTSAEDGAAALFTQSALATTAVDGTYVTQIPLTGITAGTYDVTIKGHQHLTKKLNDIALTSGNTVLNFTQADNSSTKDSGVLLAGDVSNAGTSPATLGDDVVNSVDISLLLDDLDDIDATGNGFRTNLNQDTAINSVDLSILLDNLDVTGETS